MFSLFIAFLSFDESLACNWIKLLFLKDKPCMVKPTLIDVNPVMLKYYPFMISLNKCTRNCNVFSPKMCVPKETKDKF